MCLIIHKPAGRAVCPAFLENAWRRNGHGWGLLQWGADGEPQVQRGMRLPELLAAVSALPEPARALLHLRQATVGEVNLAMAHPFEVRPGVWLMHNGSLRHLAPRQPGHSDTAELARLLGELLAGLDAAAARAALRSEAFERLLAPLLRGSMVLLADRDGVVRLGREWHRVAADEWHPSMQGIEVSNARTWRPRCPQRWRQAWSDLRWQLRHWRHRLAA